MKSHQGKRWISSLRLTLISISIVFVLMLPAYGAPLKFVVLSDSHVYAQNEGAILKDILAEIRLMNASAEPPIKYIVMNGDMVFNHNKLNPLSPDQYKKELQKFFAIVENGLKGTEIKLLIDRGNHDGHYENDTGDHASYVAKFKEVLEANKYLLAGYDLTVLNYHHVEGEVSLVLFDFISEPIGPKANLAWLSGIKKDLKPQAFFFGHYPAFSGTSEKYSMTNSDGMLDFLAENGQQYYFASHDHVFTHALLEKKDGNGTVIATVHQFITPNSAGGFFSRDYAGKLIARNPGGWISRLYSVDGVFNKAEGFIAVKTIEGGVEVTAYKKTADKGFVAGYKATLKR